MEAMTFDEVNDYNHSLDELIESAETAGIPWILINDLKKLELVKCPICDDNGKIHLDNGTSKTCLRCGGKAYSGKGLRPC